jgi:hypothetical protein
VRKLVSVTVAKILSLAPLPAHSQSPQLTTLVLTPVGIISGSS